MSDELQNLFFKSIDMWLEDSSDEMPVSLSDYLGISREDYTRIFYRPEYLFYVFYHNTHFQDVIFGVLNKEQSK